MEDHIHVESARKDSEEIVENMNISEVDVHAKDSSILLKSEEKAENFEEEQIKDEESWNWKKMLDSNVNTAENMEELKENVIEVVDSYKPDVETKLEEIMTSANEHKVDFIEQTENTSLVSGVPIFFKEQEAFDLRTEMENVAQKAQDLATEIKETVEDKVEELILAEPVGEEETVADVMEELVAEHVDEQVSNAVTVEDKVEELILAEPVVDEETVADVMEELVAEHVDEQVSNAVTEIVEEPETVVEKLVEDGKTLIGDMVEKVQDLKLDVEEKLFEKVVEAKSEALVIEEVPVYDYSVDKVEEVLETYTESPEIEQVQEQESLDLVQQAAQLVDNVIPKTDLEAENPEEVVVVDASEPLLLAEEPNEEKTVGSYIAEQVEDLKENLGQFQQELEDKIEECIRDEYVVTPAPTEESKPLMAGTENEVKVANEISAPIPKIDLEEAKPKESSFFSICSIL